MVGTMKNPIAISFIGFVFSSAIEKNNENLLNNIKNWRRTRPIHNMRMRGLRKRIKLCQTQVPMKMTSKKQHERKLEY